MHSTLLLKSENSSFWPASGTVQPNASDLFGNHIVGFLMRRLIYTCKAGYSGCIVYCHLAVTNLVPLTFAMTCLQNGIMINFVVAFEGTKFH